MRIATTASTLLVVEDSEDVRLLSVCAPDRDSVQCVVDGIEMVAGAEGPVIRYEQDQYRITVSKIDFARWLAFEALAYIDYKTWVDTDTEEG